MNRTVRAGMIALIAALATQASVAQTREIPRPTSERPPFDAAVNALGMERGVRREQTAINAIEFTAKGKMAEGGELRAVNAVVYSMSYFLPAIRVDTTWSKDERSVWVASKDLAWDEREPGIDPVPAQQPAGERLREAWLTPQGAMRALVDARIKDKAAVTIIPAEKGATFSMQLEGGAFEVVIDASHRPRRVRWTLQSSVHEAEFSNYKDWELLDVFFPQRIVRKQDGRIVADLTITDFHSNPYVVFPVPVELRSKT